MRIVNVEFIKEIGIEKDIMDYGNGLNIACYAVGEGNYPLNLKPFRAIVFDNKNEAIKFIRQMELKQKGKLRLWENVQLADKGEKIHVEFTSNQIALNLICKI